MKIRAKAMLSLILALVMVLGLAACGKGGEDGGKTDDGKEQDTPEFVYTAEYKKLSQNDNTRGMTPRVYTSEGFYAETTEKVGENIPEGVTPEYEGQYDVYENRLYFVSYEGDMKRLENYAPIAAGEAGDRKDYNSGSYIQGMVMNGEGKLITIENVSENWNEAPEGVTQDDPTYWDYYKYNNAYYIRTLDTDGSEISRGQIELGPEDYISAYRMIADDAGNALVTKDTSIVAIAPDGSTAYTIDCGEYVDSLLTLKDGRPAATYWGESGMQLSVVDAASKSLGEKIDMPYNAYNLISGGGDYDFYYTSGVNLYGYSVETQQSEKLLNWISCDVNSDKLSGISVLEDGRVLGVSTSWDKESGVSDAELVLLSKVPYESVPHKEVLTMAVMYLDYELRNSVIDFNRSNDKYRVEITDYSEYNTEEDYSAGTTKLNTEIMAGNMPDILSLSNLSYDKIASKGLLEDLYPFIDADKELNREDFFPNVMSALEVDGKLYQAVPGFSLHAVVGSSDVVGDTPGWTYEEFDQALASMPEGCQAFDVYTTKDSILTTCLALDMDDFVDWSSGECSFESQQFIDLLNFANKFPAEFDYENYDWSTAESTESLIAQGKQMLLAAYISQFNDIQYYDYYFKDATYIGYPTANGVGNMLNVNGGLAISSKCANKEAAWEFVRTVLTEDYQKELYALPTNLNAYNSLLEDAMTPEYQKDAEGNILLGESGEKIQVSMGGMGTATGEVIEFYALTQEEADKLWDVITSTTKLYTSDEEIRNIVTEQAQAFFAGQKSAEEVAKLIQSKANIFVNEQR